MVLCPRQGLGFWLCLLNISEATAGHSYGPSANGDFLCRKSLDVAVFVLVQSVTGASFALE